MTNLVKTYYPCNLKLWLMYFFTIIFPNHAKNIVLVINYNMLES